MIIFFFILAVIGSLFSQLPVFLNNGVSDYLKLLWVLPFLSLGFKDFKCFFSKRLFPFYLFLFSFFTYCILLQTFTLRQYIGADLNNIAISCLITMVSYSFWKNYGSEKRLQTLTKVLLYSSLVIALIIYINYLFGENVFSKIYSYNTKNSMGQILLNAFIIILVIYTPKNAISKIVKYFSLIVLVFVIFRLRSRATILSFIFVFLYFIFKYNDKKVRLLSFTSLLVVLALIVFNAEIYNTLVNGIFLAGRDVTDINDLSSNRFEYINNIMEQFAEGSVVWGLGNLYLDCFPLVMIFQYGFVGACIPFAFLIYTSLFINNETNHSNHIDLALFLLFWAMMVNSLFEAQPPFGPGVKCFLLWMMFGFFLAQRKRTFTN